MQAMIREFLVVVGGVILMVGAVVLFRSRIFGSPQILIGQIPQVLAQVAAADAGVVFAVFCVTLPNGNPDTDDLNIQFSIEDHRPGFDWVLIAPVNVRDQQRYIEFARSLGYEPVPMEENNVNYLRVETGDLARLCRQVLTTMYSWPEAQPIDLIVEGFNWKA
jgi:hypothetical protein